MHVSKICFMTGGIWAGFVASTIAYASQLVEGKVVGRTIRPRTTEALGFLARVLNPPPADPEAESLQKRLEPLKRAAEKKR